MVTKPLSELKPKERGKIIKVGGKGSVHRRILDMGVVSGTLVEVQRLRRWETPSKSGLRDIT